jgi:hypothetical protein
LNRSDDGRAGNSVTGYAPQEIPLGDALHGIPGAPRRTSLLFLHPAIEKTAQNRWVCATLIHSQANDRRLSPLVKIQRAQLVNFKRAPTVDVGICDIEGLRNVAVGITAAVDEYYCLILQQPEGLFAVLIITDGIGEALNGEHWFLQMKTPKDFSEGAGVVLMVSGRLKMPEQKERDAVGDHAEEQHSGDEGCHDGYDHLKNKISERF